MSLSKASQPSVKSACVRLPIVVLEPNLAELNTSYVGLVSCKCSVLTCSMMRKMKAFTNTVWLFGNPNNPLHALEPAVEQLLDEYSGDLGSYSQQEKSALRWPSGKPSVHFLQAAHLFFSLKNTWAVETGQENWRGFFHRITSGKKYKFEGDMIIDSCYKIDERRRRMGLPDTFITGLNPIMDVALLQIESLLRVRGLTLNYHLFTSSFLDKPLLDSLYFAIWRDKKKDDGSYSQDEGARQDDPFNPLDELLYLSDLPKPLAHYLNKCPLHNIVMHDEEVREAYLNPIWGKDWPALSSSP
nr:NSs [Heartland virus]WIF20444.1 nonstructural S [Heartland virus]